MKLIPSSSSVSIIALLFTVVLRLPLFGGDAPSAAEIAEVQTIVSRLPSLKELDRHITNVSGYDAATRNPNAYQEARTVLRRQVSR